MTMRLDTILLHYLEECRLRCKTRSLREIGYQCRQIIDAVGGHSGAMKEWAVADLVRLVIAAGQGNGKRPSSINGTLRILRAALRASGVEGQVRMLKEMRPLKTIYTDDQVDSLLMAAPATTRLAILLAADAGLRHQEILHLTADDVDLTDRVVRVTAKDGWTPKSHHEREIPIGNRLVAALSKRIGKLYAMRDPETQKAPRWLFPGRGSKPLSSLDGAIRQAHVKAGVEGGRDGLHKLRRTFATLALEVGTIEQVRDLLGHASIVTTQKYVTATNEGKRGVIERMQGDRS